MELYLGHAPRTVTERSYVDPDQNRFDKAIGGLVSSLGLDWMRRPMSTGTMIEGLAVVRIIKEVGVFPSLG